MEIYERCIGIESCPNSSSPGGLIKYIRKSKRVKGIFSRIQWHLAEGWRIWFYGVWFFISLPSVEMKSR